MIKLSILIATIPERADMLQSLLKVLYPQQSIDVEILIDPCMDYNIGIKRNKLLARAGGDYIVYADDDDSVSPKYVELILKAIETEPDCVGINGTITINGTAERPWFISKEYKRWYEWQRVYYRTPNHISPVKRALALIAGFPETTFGEDYAYSMSLLPLLKTEVIIDEPLYTYKYVSKQ